MDWHCKARTILTDTRVRWSNQSMNESSQKRKINPAEEKSLDCLKFHNQDRSLAIQVPSNTRTRTEIRRLEKCCPCFESWGGLGTST